MFVDVNGVDPYHATTNHDANIPINMICSSVHIKNLLCSRFVRILSVRYVPNDGGKRMLVKQEHFTLCMYILHVPIIGTIYLKAGSDLVF